MNFEVASEFERSLKRLSKKYPSMKSDYLAFLSELERNPTMGDEIFPRCRKARMTIRSKGRGKSGGGRVIFYYEVAGDTVILLFVYDKSDMENVQTAYIEQILKTMLEDNARRRVGLHV
jgi:mRNA-degrading endonuclease RelE of RelBE toxin-antitoxin system